MKAEQLTAALAHHAEGPCWSSTWGGLRWVDLLAGDVLSFADGEVGSAVERRHVGDVAACIRPRRQGGAVIAVERGFVLEEPDGTLLPLPQVWASELIRMNDGGCAPDGAFWAGGMAYDQSPGVASLVRLDPDLSTSTVLADVTVSNGLEWSPDATLTYYADTATGRIDCFDWTAPTTLTGRRAFVDLSDFVDPEVANPDGLTVDAEGGVWVALFGAGQVHRYSPDGELDAVVEVPTGQVTACTFGGDSLTQLFITTSRAGLDPDHDPSAGALFTVEPGVQGRPVRPFAG
ncbi:SMP-30/gluconolactonase/LRE family protein [Nocardioides ferulae]|uniref:SMP-30/gluconolactonase/LRE family protein n=1 Tax=Nocardioides ferulae TaxID=2340821 RepID=UPI000EB12788|nr:SMP-30/gluconolactonase/LRE family protein [Nocardioides ferulae]